MVFPLKEQLLMTDSTATMEKIETVARFRGMQVTGITICEKGRMFVCFPRWRDGVRCTVAEVAADGSYRPYPDQRINEWERGEAPDPQKFVSVQSVVAHRSLLYVLDTMNPTMKQTLGVPSVCVYDLPTGRRVRTYSLEDSTQRDSYVNDLRVDDRTGKIYLTDSGAAGLIVVDLKSGENRRLLDGDPLTTAEFDRFMPGGIPYRGTIHSDGIALDRRNGVLYFHALTAYTLYGIPTEQLVGGRIDREKIFRMKTPATDGMIIDGEGRLYMGDLENNAVVCLTPGRDGIRTLVSGGGISWPDTFALHDGFLYFTNSRIHEAQGDISEMTFTIDKIKLPE